jgi:hypothetical protein
MAEDDEFERIAPGEAAGGDGHRVRLTDNGRKALLAEKADFDLLQP